MTRIHSTRAELAARIALTYSAVVAMAAAIGAITFYFAPTPAAPSAQVQSNVGDETGFMPTHARPAATPAIHIVELPAQPIAMQVSPVTEPSPRKATQPRAAPAPRKARPAARPPRRSLPPVAAPAPRPEDLSVEGLY